MRLEISLIEQPGATFAASGQIGRWIVEDDLLRGSDRRSRRLPLFREQFIPFSHSDALRQLCPIRERGADREARNERNHRHRCNQDAQLCPESRLHLVVA